MTIESSSIGKFQEQTKKQMREYFSKVHEMLYQQERKRVAEMEKMFSDTFGGMVDIEEVQT